MAEIETSPSWAAADMGGGGKNSEKVIYYRRKNGWITWGDTQASKFQLMLAKGSTPLQQFGTIAYSEDLWGPILRHPDGPGMFPVDQVLTYRWYRKDCLPDLRPIVQQGRDLVRMGVQPQIVFPQLKGVKIVEFPCPECSRPGFHSPLHLGSHLRVMHAYDRSEVLKYGEAMGIDFSKIPGGKEIIEYDFTKATEAAQEVIEDAEPPLFEVVSAAAPASAETVAEFEEPVKVSVRAVRCPDCGKEVKPNGLSMHQMRWCKKAPVPA